MRKVHSFRKALCKYWRNIADMSDNTSKCRFEYCQRYLPSNTYRLFSADMTRNGGILHVCINNECYCSLKKQIKQID